MADPLGGMQGTADGIAHNGLMREGGGVRLPAGIELEKSGGAGVMDGGAMRVCTLHLEWPLYLVHFHLLLPTAGSVAAIPFTKMEATNHMDAH